MSETGTRITIESFPDWGRDVKTKLVYAARGRADENGVGDRFHPR